MHNLLSWDKIYTLHIHVILKKKEREERKKEGKKERKKEKKRKEKKKRKERKKERKKEMPYLYYKKKKMRGKIPYDKIMF